ncbi:MAG: hypothetical protein KDH88_01070 [Chromatiales bacterium]|nr:hypothetical protein [Chromatiales bacterium]
MDRRKRSDRRRWGAGPRFPFIDGNGVLVTGDRRVQVDRRRGGIVAEWISVTSESVS